MIKNSTKLNALLCCLTLFLLFVSGITVKKKVLIIGIDGCRPDALMKANTPNFKKLLEHSVYTLDAKADEITVSGPSWSSMLTGATSSKHKVMDNTFKNNNLKEYPHFFYRLPKNISKFSLCHWFPINKHIVKNSTGRKLFAFDPEVALGATTEIKSPTCADVIFLHFDKVDHAGHTSGFSPDNPLYLQAIEKTDEQLDPVLKALEKRKLKKPNEEWLVMSSTDHGGRGTIHGDGKDDPERRNVFIIANHSSFNSTKVDGGNVMDVAVTVLSYFNIDIKKEWNLDGKNMIKDYVK